MTRLVTLNTKKVFAVMPHGIGGDLNVRLLVNIGNFKLFVYANNNNNDLNNNNKGNFINGFHWLMY